MCDAHISLDQFWCLYFGKNILGWIIFVKVGVKFPNLLNFELSTEQQKKRNTHSLFSYKVLKMRIERLRESMFEYSGKNKSSFFFLSFFFALNSGNFTANVT